jgi:excisionase family DNA binding protein
MAKVLTLQEVAKYLRVHPSTIYRLAKKGMIPAFKLGSDWRFNLESIDHWLTAAENVPNTWSDQG